MTKDRIYAMAFHPTEEKALVFAGDKEGRIGVFDASQEKPEQGDESDDEDILPSILAFKPHARTITSFLFAPGNANCLYTSSYDTSIRKLDIAQAASIEVYAPRGDFEEDHAISCLDGPATDANLLFFTTLDGKLGRLDVRSGPQRADIYQLHDLKIGGFSLHPTYPHLLATASLDRTIKIWDLRKMSGKGELRRPHLVGEHLSRLSVSHASFSSSGQVATASYDDTIKIYDLADAKSWKPGHEIAEDAMEPAHVVRHNNQDWSMGDDFKAAVAEAPKWRRAEVRHREHEPFRRRVLGERRAAGAARR